LHDFTEYRERVSFLNYNLRQDQKLPKRCNCLLAVFLLVATAFNPTSVTAGSIDPADLTVDVNREGLVSVNAVDARLISIIDAIRPLAQIAIEGNVSAEDRVTASFQALPIEKAIAKLTDRYIYVQDEAGGPVTRIVLFREGETVALPQDKRPARVLNAKALSAWKHGDILTALDYFKAAVASDPEDWRPRADYGRLLVLMTNYDEAGPHLTRAAALDPENPRIWLDLYSYYQRTLDLELALEARKRAQELTGGDAIRQHSSGLWTFEADTIFPES
jgi:tetratricopeptide (TPR) repeat protein